MNELFIRGVKIDTDDYSSYPFSIPAIKSLALIDFSASPVTFFVGENGSGKSTIVESVAVAAGFNAEGGTKNYNFSSQNTTSSLYEEITLIRGARREKAGYFLRAESFYTTANYAENGTYGFAGPTPLYFGDKRIHEQSHGEAFMAIVSGFRPGLYIFDEPESALSPSRQFALLGAMRELVKKGSQFIIATHSPLLLAYPGATIYQLSDGGIKRVSYEDVDHVVIMKDFFHNPAAYVGRLLDE